MKVFVVDTNVAVVANCRGDVDVDEECKLTCVERIEHLIKEGIIAVDMGGIVLDEYSNHLSWSGAPGMGDRFFKYVFDNQYQAQRVLRVRVTPLSEHSRGFEELPENNFDPADRKFLAVAVVSHATVLNATDSDWSENQELMDELEVEVEELCPDQLRERRKQVS